MRCPDNCFCFNKDKSDNKDCPGLNLEDINYE